MPKRIVAAMVAITLLASCAPRSRTGAGVMLAGGAVTALVGAATLADLSGPGEDTDGNGRDDFPENDIACALGGCALALAIAAVGVVMIISGATGLADNRPEPLPQLGAAPPIPPQSITPRILPPLPTQECDAETLRLAQQARSLAQLGQCAPAMKVVALLNARDPNYAYALAASAALTPCS